LRYSLAELAIIAVARIGQHRAECNASGMRGAQLVQRDLRFGHVKRIFSKLAVSQRTEAMSRAETLGLL
jgi:hypothetical protein